MRNNSMAELERTAGEVVASAPQRHLWEWDYTLWVCMRIAEKLTQRGEERSHERLLNNHGVNVSALRKALKHWPELMALLDGPLRPRRKPDGTPKRQNEITTDIQLFRDRITQIP